MDKVFIGKVVATHGIRGELRILSQFPFKDKVFQIGKKLIIDDSDYIIKSYRVHKNFDMVTLNDYDNINQVLFLLKKDVYIHPNDLDLGEGEILDSELQTYEVLTNDGKQGIIKEIFWASETNKILRIQFDREVLIPMSSPMIVKIDKEKKQIIVDLIEGI